MTAHASSRFVFATRRSQLALAQSRKFAAQIAQIDPGIRVEELQVVTTGDRIQDRPLTDIGGKGLFVKEIEEALLDGRADFAVHSIKDVPALLAPGLRIACVPKRVDPRDVLVSRVGRPLQQLPPGTRLGTSSLRRSAHLKAIRPDLVIAPLRGNVDTRLRKVREGVVDATILAYAGLIRLGLEHVVTQILEPDVSLPAIGQGALGIECRDGDDRTITLLARLHDPETAVAVAVERGVMLEVEGSCKIPVAAHAHRRGDGRMHLRAMLADADGSRCAFVEHTLAWPPDEQEASRFGREVGRQLKARQAAM